MDTSNETLCKYFNQILHLKWANMTPTKNGALQKWRTLRSAKKCPRVIFQGRLSQVIFKRKFLNLLHDSESWSRAFKVKFFALQGDYPITLLYLIVEVGFISRVLVVL